MNDVISDWASRQMYGGALLSHEGNAMHSLAPLLLSELQHSSAADTIDSSIVPPALLLIDTAG